MIAKAKIETINYTLGIFKCENYKNSALLPVIFPVKESVLRFFTTALKIVSKKGITLNPNKKADIDKVSEEFVSLMLSDAKPLFCTGLTIFTKTV